MIYCPQCGTPLPDDSAFCENCGTPINQAQPATYEVPSYEYEAPAYQPTAPAASAPVWIPVVAMLVGMLFLRFCFNLIWTQLPYPESPVGNVIMNNVRTLLTYGIIFGLSMGGIAVCNSVCRSRGQKELSLPLTDAFIPFGCWIVSSVLSNMLNMLPTILGLRVAALMLFPLWLVITLGTAAGAYFLLRSASKSRQKIFTPQQAYDPYAQNQW